MRVLDILLTRGVMVRAVTTRLADIDLRGLVPRVTVSPRDLEGPQFSLSPSSATTMEVSPLLQDPYEAQRVCVRQSTVAGKRGEIPLLSISTLSVNLSFYFSFKHDIYRVTPPKKGISVRGTF